MSESEFHVPATPAQWHELLARVAHGELVTDFDRIGGIEQFVALLLQEADSIVRAKLDLSNGLESLFAHEVLNTSAPLHLNILLDLAAAFKPRNAIPDIFAFLRRHMADTIVFQIGLLHIDLRLRAFQALEAYFPAPPLDIGPAYKTYTELLRQYAGISTYVGYTVARLLELQVITFRDPLITAAVRRADSNALGDLVSRILAFNDDRHASEKLGELYNVARSLHQLRAFQDAVERNHGQLHDVTTRPAITVADRDIQLRLTPESQALVMNQVDFAQGIRQLTGASINRD